MSAVKAYIASLATMGVLVSGALVLLAVVGALIAFDRSPGADLERDVGSIIVGGPEHIARGAAPAAGAVADLPAPQTRTSRSPRAALIAASAPRDAHDDTAVEFPPGGGDDGCCDTGTLTSTAPSGDPPPLPARCLLRLAVEGPLRCPLKSLRLTEAPVTSSLIAKLNDTTSQLTALAAASLDRPDPRLGKTVTDVGKLCLGSCPVSSTTSR